MREQPKPQPSRSRHGVSPTPWDLEALRTELAEASPRKILKRAHELASDDLGLSFSGAEDVLLIEYAHQLGLPFRVFSLDTGRLPPETYRFFAKVEERYDLQIEYCMPDPAPVQALVRRRGLFSFYEDGHAECCGLRKVAPLRRHLSGLRSWITGQRRDQSPGTRADVQLVEIDPAFTGDGDRPLLKWNPLAAMSSAEVWDAIRAFEVPFNDLHTRGFVSIGCEPCTRAVMPGEHERAGRWWWEADTKKECGLHTPRSNRAP